MAKHNVTIKCVDRKAPNYKVTCTGCKCELDGFGAPGLAEKAAESYHDAHGTTIDDIKLR